MKTRPRVRAAEHRRSMEEEARVILRDAVGRQPGSRNLAEIARSRFGPDNGVDLELPRRGPVPGCGKAAPGRFIRATPVQV